MSVSKRKTPARQCESFSKTKQQDGPLMLLQSVAQYGQKSNDTDVSNKNKCVLSGIDSLVVTAGGILKPSQYLKDKQEIWSQYQQQYNSGDDTMFDQVGDKWWEIKPYGKDQYKYVLDNKEIGHIRIWNVDKWESAVANKQHIYVDLRSSFIKQHKPDELHDAIVSLIGKFFEYDDPSHLNIQISRVDIHTDITNGNTFLTESQIRNTISRSKCREYFYEDDNINLTESEKEYLGWGTSYNKSPQKLIPTTILDKLERMYNTQSSIGADNVIHKREVETAYFGKMSGDVWGKVYDKTKCCNEKCDLDTPLLWVSNGWNRKDKVVRVEFSMRRAFLKQLNDGYVITLDHFIHNIHNVWSFMTEKWMRMVDNIKQNNIQLSVVSNFWSVVQKSFSLVTIKLIRKRNYDGKIQQLIQQGFGCIKQAVSIGMVDNTDTSFGRVMTDALQKCLTSSYHTGELMRRRLELGLV